MAKCWLVLVSVSHSSSDALGCLFEWLSKSLLVDQYVLDAGRLLFMRHVLSSYIINLFCLPFRIKLVGERSISHDCDPAPKENFYFDIFFCMECSVGCSLMLFVFACFGSPMSFMLQVFLWWHFFVMVHEFLHSHILYWNLWYFYFCFCFLFWWIEFLQKYAISIVI